MGFCNNSMFCCTLHYVHSSFAIILIGKRELVALLSLSSWCVDLPRDAMFMIVYLLIILSYFFSFPVNDNQDGRQNGPLWSVCTCNLT